MSDIIHCTARCQNIACSHHAINVVIDVPVKFVNIPASPWITNVKCAGYIPEDGHTAEYYNSIDCEICSDIEKENPNYVLISRCSLCGTKTCPKHRKHFFDETSSIPDTSVCLNCYPAFYSSWEWALSNKEKCSNLVDLAIRKFHGDSELNQ